MAQMPFRGGTGPHHRTRHPRRDRDSGMHNVAETMSQVFPSSCQYVQQEKNQSKLDIYIKLFCIFAAL